MAFRTVQGRILKFNDEPFKNLPVLFSFTGSFTNANQYPAHSELVHTDEDGYFTVTLWTNDEGTVESKYTCKFINETFSFTLENSSTPVELSILRVPLEPTEPVEPIATAYQSLAYSGSNSLQLNQVVPDPQKILVFVNGYKAILATDFVIDGSTLIWLATFHLESSDTFEVYY